ncbi:APC family permease [Hydrogenimonas thermophila]|uniref:APC family permease n=1 Tax=Hydrogenimonas thermophila TaxID=223786 RepID=UPI0029373677|nr:APC family permease [Hydrogenimonas thermophila]WOE71053.1 APC family permease [Hydrogenimonas thermophila]WOE73571.1 APC family permease [Hydrogenimonas thermophila]
MTKKKAFGFWSAIFLGIGSMVGAGIFIVIGEAGAIAGKLVIFSFLIAGIIALLCGYSLAKLAITYPSRGGIIEYLVQSYKEGYFSGSLGVLFYFAQLVALAAVSKSFGTYAATYISSEESLFWTNLFALGILGFFVLINLIGASMVAKSESLIVLIKVSVLIIFTVAALVYIDPSKLLSSHTTSSINIFYTLGLTFFAYQGFSVITNSIEDMENPKKVMLFSMITAIIIVTILYIAITIAVFGNLTLNEIIKSQDFALAEAAKPAFGTLGFKIIAATALFATASAINATLYSVTQISYVLAKNGELPKIYEHNIFHNSEGLIISALLIVPMILFLNLGTIASIAAVTVLLIQGLTHAGHLLKLKETGANPVIVILAVIGTFGAAGFAIYYSSQHTAHFTLYVTIVFFLAFAVEVALQLFTQRKITKQFISSKE